MLSFAVFLFFFYCGVVLVLSEQLVYAMLYGYYVEFDWRCMCNKEESFVHVIEFLAEEENTETYSTMTPPCFLKEHKTINCDIHGSV